MHWVLVPTHLWQIVTNSHCPSSALEILPKNRIKPADIAYISVSSLPQDTCEGILRVISGVPQSSVNDFLTYCDRE